MIAADGSDTSMLQARPSWPWTTCPTCPVPRPFETAMPAATCEAVDANERTGYWDNGSDDYVVLSYEVGLRAHRQSRGRSAA
nr:hypothetical protein ICEMyc226_00251 [Mycolicibacterium sp.]